MKSKQIKVWPELVSYLPSVSPFRGMTKSNHCLNIDFSGCREITSTGLTFFLIRLLKFMLDGPTDRGWETNNHSKNHIFDMAIKLAFFNHLNNYFGKNRSMFGLETNFEGPFNKPIEHFCFYNRETLSFPVYCLKFNDHYGHRRDLLKYFKKDLKDKLTFLEKEYHIHINQLIIILTEMAKNSADHTSDNAFLGIDIVKYPEKKLVALHFVFGDLGNGIKQHIEENLPPNIREKRSPHYSLYECYYWALKHGYTSNPSSGENKGIGMSLILDGAKGINLNLSVFDVYSRGVLSTLSKNTHEEIRKHFYPFSREANQGFYFYGVIEGCQK